MLTISIHKPMLLRYSHVRIRSHQKFHKIDPVPFVWVTILSFYWYLVSICIQFLHLRSVVFLLTCMLEVCFSSFYSVAFSILVWKFFSLNLIKPIRVLVQETATPYIYLKISIFGVLHISLFFCLYQMNRKMEAKSSQTRKMEELSVKHPTPFIPKLEPSGEPDLQFDRLQTSDQDLVQEKKFEFGRFIAREAILDEELWVSKLSRWWHLNHEVLNVYAICVPWIISCGCMLLDLWQTAAWLRAESHWEDRANDRCVLLLFYNFQIFFSLCLFGLC